MKRASLRLCFLLAIVCIAGILKATLPSITIGNWTASSSLSQARSNGATVLLSDGRILFTGGDSGSAPVQSAEFFGADGTVSSAGTMNVARSRHFAVVMSDGRVLVGGGNTTGGGTTNSAEVYDPGAGTWTATNPMTSARANATAAVLPDGRVVIAGGDNSGAPSNTIEIFDPSSGNFTFAGTMSASRTKQAMAVLQNGQVLIIGGFDGTNPLASTDVFDPVADTVAAGPALATARYSASATTLLNGQVAVIGGASSDGNGGTTDLASIEVFDTTAAAFSTVSATLATAREAHQAYLLPNNNNVLIAGGISSGAALASSELFTAQASATDGSWSYSVSGTGAMTTARAGVSGAANQQNGPTSKVSPMPGMVIVGGGTDATGAPLSSTEAYGYPTVQTDQADYPPGTTVKITGSGFTPGETVTISMVESPLIDTHGPYTIVADGNGNISNSSFITDTHDENVRFFMSAVGSQSGLVAQNTFTDSKPQTLTITTAATVTVTAGGTANYSLQLTFNGTSGSCSSPMSLAYTSGTPTGATTTFTPTSITGTAPTPAGTGSVAIATTASTPPGSYPFTITASQGTCTQSGTATANGTLVVAGAATHLSVTGFPATVTSGTPGSFTVTALDTNNNTAVGYTGTVNFTSSDAQATFSPTSYTFVAGDNGTHTFTNGATLKTAGTQSITATDTLHGTITGSQTGITVNASAANSIAATAGTPQSAQVGAAFPTALQATVKDASNNPVPNATVTFTAPGSGASGKFANNTNTTTATTNASGVATASTFTANTTTGTYTVTASVSGVGSPANFSLTNTAGPATKFVVTAPASATAGTAFSVTVTAQDANGNIATSYTGTVKFTLGTADAGATLPLNYTFTLGDAGQHLFTNGFTLTKAVTQTVIATDTVTATITGTSNNITVSGGTAAKLVFGQQPSNTFAGATITPAVTVLIEDQYGNATTSTANVSLAIGTNPSSGTLGGTTTVAAVSGTATFSSLNINNAGSGYTLSATSGGLTGTTSSSFDIVSNLAFTSTAVTEVAGVCSPQVTVQRQNSNGTAASLPLSETVALTAGVTSTTFYSDPNCATALSGGNLNIAANQSSGFFYFKNTSATLPPFNNLLTATKTTDSLTAQTTQTESVIPNIAFANPPGSSTVGLCSPTAAKIVAVDGTGTSIAPSAAIPVTLATSSLSGAYYSDSACTTVITTATIPAGNKSGAMPFYKDNSAGTPTLTATAGTAQATTQATITKATAVFSNLSAPTIALGSTPTTFSGTVNKSGAVVPTGNVTITLAGTSGPISQAATLDASGNFSASIATGTIPAGTYTIQYSYPGDTNFNPPSPNPNVSNSLTVISPPTIAKQFGAASIPVSGSTSLSFTITNANTTQSLSGISFSDPLPAGLAISTPNGLIGGTCASDGGTITATAGTSTISLSGATIPASGNCTFSVNVTGTTAGVKNNTTGNVSSMNGGSGNTASASLTVLAPPSIAKVFGAATVPLNGTTSLTFTITNPTGNTVALNGLAFTDTFPAGLVVAGTPSVTNTCNGTVTATAGAGSINLANGTLAANTLCRVSVNVTGTSAGVLNNTTGAVSSTNGGTGNTASASITVDAPPTISKAFGASQINLNTNTSLTFTISNSNTNNLTGVAFTDVLPAGLVVATPAGVTTSCGGTTTAAAGSGSISLSGASLGANASCVISVNVTGTTTGVKNNTTGAITSTEGGTGTVSNTATINVVGTPPQITSGNSATFTAGVANSFTVTTSGTPTASLSESGSLPAGVTFTDNGNGTAKISGTATTAGTFPITITAQNGVPPNATQGFTLTVVAGSPASIVTFSGSGQITTVNMAFGSSLVALVTDAYSNPVNGATVVFAAPASGPSGSFSGNPTFTTSTDTTGKASAAFTANTAAGAYVVTASVSGVTTPASFTLQNNPGAITTLALTPATSSINAGDSQTYKAEGVDQYDNPVADVTTNTTFTITPDGSCTGATCTTNVADVNGSSHMVLGTYTNGAKGTASLTVNAGSFTKLQILTPGETAAPGTATGKTGTPNTEYVNGQFNVTVNAVDSFDNVVSSMTDTVHIASSDSQAKLPADAALVNGTGAFSVTLETVSNPANTTITASDVTNNGITSDTSPKIEVIVAYTAAMTPTMAGTGDATAYTLTINNAQAPNTNNLKSVQVAIPNADQGSVTGVSVSATQQGGPAANWTYDAGKLPGTLRFAENSTNDAITPGGTITITFTATSNATVTSTPVTETWITTAYADEASSQALPLGSSEPAVQIGKAPEITSANTTTFTFGTAGTFAVTSTGVPTPTLSESGALPGGVTFTDNGSGAGTIAGTPTQSGSFPITITAHSGFGPDATQAFTLVVSKADTTTTVVADVNPSVFGQSVKFTAAVTANGSVTGTPTGTVQFMDGASPIGAPQTLDGSGRASVSTSSLTVGPHSITAVYGGDTNFNKTGADTGSTALVYSQAVNKADSISTVVSSVNPSVFGQSVTFTATVSAVSPGVGTPTGTVQFMDGANPIGAAQPLDGSGHASVSTSSLSVTSHSVKAVYSGDGNFSPTGTGASTATAVTQVVNKADSSSAVTSNLNPSTFGQPVTFTATVTAVAPATGTPGGTVQFMDGANPLGSPVALSSGQATYSTSSLNVPTHSIKAVYSGDVNFNGTGTGASTSTAVTQTVNKANAVISVTGYSVTYTATPYTATGTAIGVFGEALSGLDLSGTTHTNAGPYSDPWTFTDTTGNYNNASGNVTDIIAKADAKVLVTPYDVTYDGNPHTATGTATGVGSVDLSAGLNLTGTMHTHAGRTVDTWIFTGGGNYNDASGTVTDVIEQATPLLTWNTPADITYGTALSATQLNATANVPGTFAYNPSFGTVLTAGSSQPLVVLFTPTDAVDYKTATANQSINVNPVTPRIIWSNPADITYPAALSSTQLNAIAPAVPLGVTGWWTADEGTGTMAQNSAGADSAMLKNGASWAAGQYNTAFALDASQQQYVDAGNTPDLQVSQGDFSVSAWVKFNSLSGDMSIADKMGSAGAVNDDGWRLLKQADNHFWFCIGQTPGLNSCGGVHSTTSATTGTWYHVAAVKTAGTIYIYVNGVQEGSAPVGPINDDNQASLRFGSYVTQGAYLDGSIDEVQLFNHALTATEVQNDYSGMVAGNFAYTPASGTVLSAGNAQKLSSKFTPTDASNYNSASKDVSINVLKGNQTITFAALANKTYGDAPFVVSAMGGDSGNPVTFSAAGNCTSSGTNGSTITVTAAGSCTVTADQAGNDNYNDATPVPQTFSIAKANAIIKVTPYSVTYDANPHTATGTAMGVESPMAADLSSLLHLDATTHTDAGTYNDGWTFDSNSNYNSSSGTITDCIKKANVTVVFSNIGPFTFNGNPQSPAFVVNGVGGQTLPSSGTASYSGTQFDNTAYSNVNPPVHGGNYTETVAFAGNNNYNALSPSATQAFTIQKANQTITFAVLGNKTYGDANFAVSASSDSGLAVTFAVGAADNCTISGNTVHLTGAGSCTVTASQTGSNDYNAATSVPRTFSIAKANVTVVFSSTGPFTFNGSAQAPAFVVNGVNNEVLTAYATASYAGTQFDATAYSNANAPSHGGNYTETVAFAGNNNYNALSPSATQAFTIQKAYQAITFAALTNRTYGDADFAVSATSDSGLTVSFAASGNCTVGGTTVHITGAGSCTITASQTGNNDYSAATAVPQIFSIAKASVTVVFGGTGPFTYNGSPQTPSFVVNGVNGELLTTSATASYSGTQFDGTVYTSPTAPTHGGNYTETVAFAGNNNYNALSPSATQAFIINKATETITFGALVSHTYGDSDFSVSATSSSGLMVSFAATGNCTVSGTTVHITGAGSCTVTGSQAGNDDYSAATVVPQTFSIAKATPAVIWTNPADIHYGTALSGTQLNATFTWVVNGTNVNVTGTATYTPPLGTVLTAGNGQVLSVSFAPTDTSDYNAPPTKMVSINVQPVGLTITASSGVMTYGTSPVVVTPNYSGFVNGDGPGNLTPGPTCGPVFSSVTPVNSYITSCTGAADPNYTISYVAGNVVVNQAATTTSVVSSSANNTSTFMQLVTLTATVTDSTSGSTGTPTGTVTFYNGGSSIGTGTLSVVGGQNVAVLSTTTLPATGIGTYDNITAVYGGDTNFKTSTSPVLQQTVQPAPIASLNPTSLSFGNTNIGATSKGAVVTLSNLGDAALTLGTGALTFTGPNAGDFAQTNNCGSSLGYAMGSNTCTITVTFTPSQTGVEIATLQITDNDDDTAGAQQFVSLTGSGLSTISGTSLYTDAIFATSTNCGAITFSGGSTVNSFNSSMGYASSNQNDGGNVGTNGNVTLNGGNSAIYGSAAVNSTTSGTCSKSSVTGLTSNGGAQVKDGLIALGGSVNYPAPPAANPVPPTTTQNVSSCPSGMTGCTNISSKVVSLAPGQYGNVSISGGDTAHVSKGTYNFNSLTLSGKSILYVDSGPVVINIAGASLSGGAPVLDVTGGSIQNPTHIPANLQFAYGGSRGVNLSGGSDSYAVVYAPNALVNLSGGTDFFGSIIGGTVTSSGGTAVHYDANLPNIQSGNYIWFDAVVNNVNGLPASQQVKLYLTNASISFTANGNAYNLPVPNGVVTFNSTSQSSGAKSAYDLASTRWSTNVAKTGLTGNTFVTGLAFPVPANFPGGIQNVTFSASFSTDTPGITLQWQWAAGVYTSFNSYATPTNSNMLGVNAEDGSANMNGTDPAGTPENYKQYATFGATGGYFSAASGVVPTVAQMSASPSSLSFGNQAVGTTSAQQVSVLTNNYTSTLNISNIALGGTNPGDFSLSPGGTNNCVGMSSLASGASCTLYVTFTPSISSFESGKVVITDAANNSPQTVYLNGTGY